MLPSAENTEVMNFNRQVVVVREDCREELSFELGL